MKPFPRFLKSHVPEFLREECAEVFATLSAEVHDRLRAVKPTKDGRRGFGTVYTSKQDRGVSIKLGTWNWNHATAENYRTDLGVTFFVDDPLGAMSTDSLAARMRVATAFADAANALFADKSDSDFVARPLEVVSAADGSTPGVRSGEEGDLLVVDLMLDMSSPKIVDRLVRDRFERERAERSVTGIDDLHPGIWHEIVRLNAARAMLAPSSRPVHFPDRSSLKRRLSAVEDECYGTNFF